jgi:hypothetical protein
MRRHYLRKVVAQDRAPPKRRGRMVAEAAERGTHARGGKTPPPRPRPAVAGERPLRKKAWTPPIASTTCARCQPPCGFSCEPLLGPVDGLNSTWTGSGGSSPGECGPAPGRWTRHSLLAHDLGAGRPGHRHARDQPDDTDDGHGRRNCTRSIVELNISLQIPLCSSSARHEPELDALDRQVTKGLWARSTSSAGTPLPEGARPTLRITEPAQSAQRSSSSSDLSFGGTPPPGTPGASGAARRRDRQRRQPPSPIAIISLSSSESVSSTQRQALSGLG